MKWVRLSCWDVTSMSLTPASKTVPYIAILVAACSQLAFNPGSSPGSIPLSSIVLFLGAVTVLVLRRNDLCAPRLEWPQSILFALMCVGLLGLNRSEVLVATKELAQLCEIFLIAWYVFYVVDEETWREIPGAAGMLCVLLVVLQVSGLRTRTPFELSDAKCAALVCVTLPFALLWLKDRSGAIRWPVVAALCVGSALGFANGGLVLVFVLVLLVASALLETRWLKLSAPLSVLVLVLASINPLTETSAWNTLNPHYDADHKKRLFIEYSASAHAPGAYPLGAGLGHYKRAINVLRQSVGEDPHPAEHVIPENTNNQYLLTLVEAGAPAALGLLVCLGAALLSVLSIRQEAAPEDRENCSALAASLLAVLSAGVFCTVLSKGIGIWVGAILGMASRLQRSELPRPFIARLAVPPVVGIVCLLLMFFVNTDEDRVTHVSALNRSMRSVLGQDASTGIRNGRVNGRSEGGLEIVKLGKGAKDGAGSAVRVEGEAFTLAAGGFKAVSANDASGNKALEIPLDLGKGVGHALYEVELKEAGEYVLSARVYWRDGCSNSLGFTILDQKGVVASELFEKWHDLRCRRTFRLPAGTTTIKVRNVEDGVRLDYFELRALNAP